MELKVRESWVKKTPHNVGKEYHSVTLGKITIIRVIMKLTTWALYIHVVRMEVPEDNNAENKFPCWIRIRTDFTTWDFKARGAKREIKEL